MARHLASLLPEGRQLPHEVWERRHQVIVRVAAAQTLGLGLLALLTGEPYWVVALVVAGVGYPLAFLALPGVGRRVRSGAATLSLLGASIALVALLDGLTEAHFH